MEFKTDFEKLKNTIGQSDNENKPNNNENTPNDNANTQQADTEYLKAKAAAEAHQ